MSLNRKVVGSGDTGDHFETRRATVVTVCNSHVRREIPFPTGCTPSHPSARGQHFSLFPVPGWWSIFSPGTNYPSIQRRGAQRSGHRDAPEGVRAAGAGGRLPRTKVVTTPQPRVEGDRPRAAAATGRAAPQTSTWSELPTMSPPRRATEPGPSQPGSLQRARNARCRACRSGRTRRAPAAPPSTGAGRSHASGP
jgi:hypothetical protein